MSKYIVLYGFNSYYNRIVKRLATFADYEALITPGENTPASYTGFKREYKNFDIRDGVYAKMIIKVVKGESLICKQDQPDYIVVDESFMDGEGENAVEKTRLSRWFVLEASRIRGLKYELSLRRDLLADYFNEALYAPVFIQRGCPQEYTDPAIFNKEGFTFNQIKVNEILLNRNKLSGKGAGWVVGYLAREDSPTDLGECNCKQEISLNVPNYSDLPARLQSLITNGEGYQTESNECTISFPARVIYFDGGSYLDRVKRYEFNVTRSNDITNPEITTVNEDSAIPYVKKILGSNFSPYINAYIQSRIGNNISSFTAAFQSYFESVSDEYEIDDSILAYNGTYYAKDGKYYKLTITTEYIVPIKEVIFSKTYTPSQILSGYDSLAVAARNLIQSLYINDANNEVIQNPDVNVNATNGFTVTKSGIKYYVYAEETDAVTFKVTIPKERNQLLDAPYDIFCMPLGAVTVKGRVGESNYTTLVNTALAAARGIAAKGGTRVYDIQILPYCPYDEVIDSNGDIDLSTAEDKKDYTVIEKIIGSDHTPIGILLYPRHCKGTFTYDLSDDEDIDTETLNYLSRSETVLEQKVLSETSFVRFVSPNFAALYDMNPQKNGNSGAKLITIDYYYKPYTPYLHVKPVFDSEYGIYGVETHDPKGLVCSGDFSIATASSKWEEYQIQNKNFQNQFDRQIQNLDVNNAIEKEKTAISGVLGVASSALSGAGAGAVAGSAGGPAGAAAGAVTGGLLSGSLSTVGLVKDLEFLKRSQSEARSYSIDMYTYQLGNIKALPNTLNKISSFTPNNKIFPFIEIYTCTDVEKEALRNKIKYNGMTIMRIGNIADFINNSVSYFVQGELIRLVGIDEDSHVIAEIANEIKEGAYFYGNNTIEP